MIRRTLIATLTGSVLVVGLGATQNPPQSAPPPAQTQTPPVPKPFPGSNPNSSTTPSKPSTPPAQSADKPATPPGQTPQATPAQPESAPPAGAPTEASLGVKLFPDAVFLESFDAGRGQRLYLFGTNAPYVDVIAFYRRELRSGTELFKEPAMQEFDLAVKFQKETMAYPPSVVVKDYSWTGTTGDLKEGYVFVDGTTEKRFKTIVQIVPR